MARSSRLTLRRTLEAPLLLLAVLATGGCYAEATTGAVVTTDYVPARVEVYPHEYYDGHVVYLIDDHWYYHDGAHWVYYRQEPEVLVRRRTVIHQAPPAVVREQTVVHEAPPAVEHERTVVHEAPPAHVHHPHRWDPERRHAERRAPRAD